MCKININDMIQKLNTIRSAPDAMMAGIGYSVNLSLFNRDNEANPKWSAASSGSGIKFLLADAVIIAVVVTACLAIACMASMICFRIKYRKRFS